MKQFNPNDRAVVKNSVVTKCVLINSPLEQKNLPRSKDQLRLSTHSCLRTQQREALPNQSRPGAVTRSSKTVPARSPWQLWASGLSREVNSLLQVPAQAQAITHASQGEHHYGSAGQKPEKGIQCASKRKPPRILQTLWQRTQCSLNSFKDSGMVTF